jgi:choline kinase
MKVIVIAAGSGKRVGEETKHLPKHLIKVNDKTIMERQSAVYKKYNIDQIIIITGPNKEKFTADGFTYVEDVNYEKHDILGSLMEARKYIAGEVMIVYSDIVFDNAILSKMVESKDDIGIAIDLEWEKSYVGRTDHPLSEAENVVLDTNQNVIEIKKNISVGSENTIGEFLGIMKMSPRGSEIFVKKFEELEKSHRGQFHNAPSFEKAYLTDMIQELIDLKIKVVPIIVSGKWCEIDTLQDLQRACRLFP